MQDKDLCRTPSGPETSAFPPHPVASSPCGLDAVATAPWEYGPEFLATLDWTLTHSPACEGQAFAPVSGRADVEPDGQGGPE